MKLVHETMPAAAHRPDIEGLRAVAVAAVLLFHLGVDRFGGGFVGVDVFFVISGFLIGGIVVREAGEGTFRFSDYLVRRVRRIVPVMLFVLAVVSIAAATVLMPVELVDYSWGLGFSSLFLGNFHFWLHGGAYGEREEAVLLHIWTLGVEGQFYILLPLVALGLLRFGRNGMWIGLVALGIASAAFSMWLPSAAFYSLPARLWEFLLGMMVAITPLPFLTYRWVREGLAIIGMGLIVFAILTLDIDWWYPGWRPALPTIGAAAIIAAGCGGNSIIGWALSLAPIRFIGKISYSLYLWHWPVITLMMLGLPAAELDARLMMIATAISFGLSVLSWRYVEEPLRRGSFPIRPLLIGSGVVTTVLVAVAIVWSLTAGWPQRFSERGQQLAASTDYPIDRQLRSGTCFLYRPGQSIDEDACLVEREGTPTVLVIGDSHAAHLVPGLIAQFPGSSISQITASTCRPVINQPAGTLPFCGDLMDRAFAEFIPRMQPDLVILSARWEEGDIRAIGDTLAALNRAGQEVLVIGPIAEWRQPVPRLLTIAHERGEGSEIAEAMRVQGQPEFDRRLALLAAQTGVEYFSMLSIQCDPTCFYLGEDGDPLVFDLSHFTQEASELFAGEIAHPALIRAAD